MGHAGGKLADHFHFLRADKLSLEPLVFGARLDFCMARRTPERAGRGIPSGHNPSRRS